MAANRIIFPGDYEFLKIQRPVLRYWKADDDAKGGLFAGSVALSTHLPKEVGMTQTGTQELVGFFGGKSFSFPKPSSLVQYLIGAATYARRDAIVLDSFAGSGTTAQAVLQQNAADGGHRRFVLIEMELKGYQQEVLQDLEDYIAAVEVAGGDLPKAYESYWDARGVRVGHGSDMHAYSDRATPGVPRVTLKVPTAGGKTLIACCALGPLVEAARRAGGERVVAWFVPSDAILQQTYARLSDPRHPYRVMLERAAGRRVRVVNKEDALFGEGITPPEVEGQLTVSVLSVQSFATNNAEGRRVYRENGNLLSWVKYYTAETPRVEESDETGLIQVLAHLRPVVVIDESHNFHAELREEVMRQLHPRFILNLTATPRQESNIISSVDALRLKEVEMVKLPVVVYNFSQEEEVVQAAVAYQRSLERRAREAERERGAEYVRPIVLLQAQPRRGEEMMTYDKIKEQLLGVVMKFMKEYVCCRRKVMRPQF